MHFADPSDLEVTQRPTSPLEKRAARRWAPINGCRVAVTIDIPDSTKYAVLPDVEERMKKILKGRCPAVKTEGTSMTIAFLATSRVPVEAIAELSSLVPELTNILGRDPSAAFSLWLTAAESDLPTGTGETLPTALPPCVGVGEAAEILGVSKQRVHQLTRAPGFPQPVMRLKATPVWLRDEVLRFQQNRSLRPGPVPISLSS